MQFFIDHNGRDSERIAERLEQIRKAIPATTDAAVVTPCSAAIVVWAGLLKQVLTASGLTTRKSTSSHARIRITL